MARIIEAYIGEYASGKSENAINRALQLAKANRKVTLTDLDLVEPFYTLRPLIKELELLGIDVVAWDTKETMGLGEAGTLLKPAMRWVLRRPGDIILDIGYGVEGAKTLNLVEDSVDNPHLKVYLVVNTTRPMTMTVADIVAQAVGLGTIHGLINNTHLGDETEIKVVQDGAAIVTDAARELGLPVIATVVEERLAGQIGPKDRMGNPVRVIKRYMPGAYW